MKTIEPKSIFANERTLLHYMSKATFLLTTAVGLSFGVSHQDYSWISHAVKVVIGLLAVGYLVVVFEDFKFRQRKLLSRRAVEKEGYEKLDVGRSPMLAASVIVLGAIVSLLNSSYLVE